MYNTSYYTVRNVPNITCSVTFLFERRIELSSSLLHESTGTKTRFVFQVLNPCSLTFKYLMPASIDGGQDIDIELEKMLFEFSPGLLTTATNVVTAFTSLQKVCAFVCVCVFFSNF